jgi:hypothetical protein
MGCWIDLSKDEGLSVAYADIGSAVRVRGMDRGEPFAPHVLYSAPKRQDGERRAPGELIPL